MSAIIGCYKISGCYEYYAQVILQFCFLYTELVVKPYLLIPLKDMANSYLNSQLWAALLPRYLHSITHYSTKRQKKPGFLLGSILHTFSDNIFSLNLPRVIMAFNNCYSSVVNDE